MPRKKSIIGVLDQAEGQMQNLFGQFKLGESYTSLILGIIVVIAVSILLITFFRNRNIGLKPETASQNTQSPVSTKEVSAYTVESGDTLWSIAEKTYKSGYNWVDIAKANNLENPDMVETGTKLTIPKVEPKIAAVNSTNNVLGESSITGSTYTVKKGDYLWEIAVRAYGDGYRWVDIAKANNLENPDLIFEGNNLTLPR